MNKGRVVRIIGPVIDIEFPEEHLPAILNAVRIQGRSSGAAGEIDVTAEVEQHLGENRVRCVAMEPTEGMVRGMEAVDLGEAISVPVGRETLGRVINVIGKPVDQLGPLHEKERWPIHRQPPSFEQQSSNITMFETGIKVIDLLEPYMKGGKTGLFGGAGDRKSVV